ncbi:low-density lipoprotein receptor domain-containing jelly belly protein isoform X2 [Brevipalpus obovatus]|uniref:low-density lipoprotein receptor domain-containing jelly belly protein isoform X2 n=1 Tax=Brevipalpus obovatus TaxID=246614 RepID=UPI003D9F443C
MFSVLILEIMVILITSSSSENPHHILNKRSAKLRPNLASASTLPPTITTTSPPYLPPQFSPLYQRKIVKSASQIVSKKSIPNYIIQSSRMNNSSREKVFDSYNNNYSFNGFSEHLPTSSSNDNTVNRDLNSESILSSQLGSPQASGELLTQSQSFPTANIQQQSPLSPPASSLSQSSSQSSSYPSHTTPSLHSGQSFRSSPFKIESSMKAKRSLESTVLDPKTFLSMAKVRQRRSSRPYDIPQIGKYLNEDRMSCMFYKTTKAHLNVIADAFFKYIQGQF